MMILALVGRPIGKLVRRVMLALVPPTTPAHPDVPPVYPKFPLF